MEWLFASWRHIRWYSVLGPALLALPASPAWGEGSWSASIGVTSDYVFRGVSQTYDSAAVQLGGSYQSPIGWFVGVWGSNVDPYPHAAASTEVDVFAGITRPLGSDLSARLAYTHYAYLDDPRPAHYDYDELSISLGYLDRLAATVSFVPDISSYSALRFAHRKQLAAFELTSRWPVWHSISFTAGAGYYDLQRMFGVSYWAANAGLSYVYRKLDIELAHYFAQDSVRRLYEEQSANGTWALSAAMHF